MLTDGGVRGDPAVFDAGTKIVERKDNAMLGLLVGHGELGARLRLLREVGRSLLRGHGFRGSHAKSLPRLRRDHSSGHVLHF